jgi:hypothetical protein
MHRASALALSTFLLLGLSPAQNPPRRDQEPKPPPEPKMVLSKAAQLANKKLEKSMQGAWSLTDIQLVTQDTAGLEDMKLDHVGFALVSGHYIALEFHFRLLGQPRMDLGRSFVTGLHRFEFEEDGTLETSTVIGARANEAGATQFEPPNQQRHYTVTVEGTSMTMVRDDGHTLVFERLEDDRSRVDFFGNPADEKIFNDDIDEDGNTKGVESKDKKQQKKKTGDEDG